MPTVAWRRVGRSDAAALATSLAALGLCVWVYSGWLGVRNPAIVGMTFLLVVFVTAAQSALRVAVVTSIAAVGCFNFFFLPPVGTFTIAEPQNWVALLTLLTVSIFVSRLSAQARSRAVEALARRDELTQLFDLTRDILLTTDAADPIAAIAGHIARRFRLSRVSIFRLRDGVWSRHGAGGPLVIEVRDLDKVMAAARTTLEFDAEARAYAGAGQVHTRDGAAVWLEPLRLGMTPIGLLALEGSDLAPGARDAIAGITAIAVERLQLLDERKEADLLRRSADLKSALLASLSHDLRTPLTAVMVAADNLRAGFLSDREREEQLELVQTELGRLHRLFENIVDMARIETQAVSAEREWVQPAGIIRTAALHVEHALKTHRVDTTGDADEMVVFIDPRLTSAALAHLIENAAQYSPDGSPIEVTATIRDESLQLDVRDHGAGIAAADLDRLFERLYRGSAGRSRFGTGMGLAIARGLLAAEGGRVWAQNHRDGGAVFTLNVPAEVRTMRPLEGAGA